MKPEQAIAELRALAGARVAARLADGPTASTWALDLQGQRLVLTIDKPVARDLGLDRGREFDLLRQLVRYDLGPVPLAVDRGRGLLAVKAVPGMPVAAADFRQPETLADLGRLLARLHRLPVTAPRLDLAAVVTRYARIAGSPEAKALANEAARLLASLPGSGVVCVCHNDIHPGNVLRQQDGRLILVDWEYSGCVDSLYELCVLAEHNGLSDAEVAGVLDGYRAGAGKGPTARTLELWRPLYRAMQQLWHMATDPA